MFRRGFIRTLWGDETIPRSQTKIRNDVRWALSNSQSIEAINYMFGRKNQEFLRSLGLPSRLIDDREVVWPGAQMWRHKLEAWKTALTEFDEIVFLDWDVRIVQPIKEDFWARLQSKADLQACLLQYRRIKAPWRASDLRKVPSAAFVYIRAAEVADNLIELWNSGRFPTEEICMAAFTDLQFAGWQGTDAYYRHFEPDVCRLNRKSAYPVTMNEAKGAPFLIHV